MNLGTTPEQAYPTEIDSGEGSTMKHMQLQCTGSVLHVYGHLCKVVYFNWPEVRLRVSRVSQCSWGRTI